ncbi:MAG: ORF6N domain-containing protein [Lacunisphaera sp.]
MRVAESSSLAESSSDSLDRVLHIVRGERVILDVDLARIYGVETRVLNQAVRRNRGKFPRDFLLELTVPETVDLNRSQSVIGSQKHRDKRFSPFAFTEHGALMAANILSSPQATQMSVFVIRAFVKMRSLLTDTRELAGKLAALETELKSRLDSHETAIVDVLQRIMILLDPPPSSDVVLPSKEMGFHATLPVAPVAILKARKGTSEN